VDAVARTASSLALAFVLVAVIAAGSADSSAARSRSATSFTFAQVVGGLDNPVAVTSAPGAPNTLYVVQQSGKILIVRNGSVAGTFLDLTSLISCCGEQGLLSLAFSPHYTTNHLFYVYYTDLNGNSRVARYRSSGGVGVPSSATILLAVHQPYTNHNGGSLQFDKRGYLYMGFGDGGSGGDPNQNSQNMKTHLGKLLRSATTTPNTKWKIVALGLRNPWRYSFDSANDNLWIGDVGQNKWEEVDFRAADQLDKLANYGWSRYEGTHSYDTTHHLAGVGQLVNPVVQYSHSYGCAIMGGYVYRGSAVPKAKARYFYGDECSGTIWTFAVGVKGHKLTAPVVSAHVSSLSSFGVDGNGNLYAVSLGGTIYELKPS
jgi:glucose/arabinose dehydrogenase